MHSWNTFDARMNHGHTRTHKTHHGLDMGESTTFPLIVFSMHGHGACTQMSFYVCTQIESPDIFEIGIPTILEAHNFLFRPLIEVRSKEKF
jgi:hypothetical protein